jgi:hypothetical protein
MGCGGYLNLMGLPFQRAGTTYQKGLAKWRGLVFSTGCTRQSVSDGVPLTAGDAAKSVVVADYIPLSVGRFVQEFRPETPLVAVVGVLVIAVI